MPNVKRSEAMVGYEHIRRLLPAEREVLEKEKADMVERRQVAINHCNNLDKHPDPDWCWEAEVTAYDHDIWVVEKALEWNISEQDAYSLILIDFREKE